MIKQRLCKNPRCNKPLNRKANEKPHFFKRREFCDRSCKGQAQRVPVETRYCDCGAPIERKPKMSPEGYKRISTCGNVECIYIKLSNVARGARGAYKTNPEVTQMKTRAIRNFLRFDTTVAEMYPALIERHETIILEPDENNYSEKCSCCHERVANPWTGKCDVCILPKSNGSGKGFRYL